MSFHAIRTRRPCSTRRAIEAWSCSRSIMPPCWSEILSTTRLDTTSMRDSPRSPSVPATAAMRPSGITLISSTRPTSTPRNFTELPRSRPCTFSVK
jgi:hypothetical protein